MHIFIFFMVITWIFSVSFLSVYFSTSEKYIDINNGEKFLLICISILPIINHLYVVIWLMVNGYRKREYLCSKISIRGVLKTFNILWRL